MIAATYAKFLSVKEEFLGLSAKEKLFILYAMICGFLICAEYGIIRPVSNSLFIHAYSTEWMPYAWLAAVPVNLLAVALYNRFLAKWGCIKMFVVIASLVLFGHVFCALFFQKIFALAFIFYIWKEIYILLMLQQLWSVIHTTIKMNHAKYLYGIIFGVGGIGSLCGSLIPSFCAQTLGSEALLYFSLPLYVLLILFYRHLIKNSEALNLKEELCISKSAPLMHGMKLIAGSKFLLFILCLVAFMQISSSLIDFQFNYYLEELIPDKDLRTQYFGRILSMVHFATIAMQFLGSFLLLQFLGLNKTHLLIPLTFIFFCMGTLVFPTAALISLSFIAVKSFDFSLFGVVKEILYVPLKTDEKFRAKAIIDIFAYRTSKSLAAFFIVVVQVFSLSNIVSILTWMNLLIFACWIFLITIMFKNQELRLISQKSG